MIRPSIREKILRGFHNRHASAVQRHTAFFANPAIGDWLVEHILTEQERTAAAQLLEASTRTWLRPAKTIPIEVATRDADKNFDFQFWTPLSQPQPAPTATPYVIRNGAPFYEGAFNACSAIQQLDDLLSTVSTLLRAEVFEVCTSLQQLQTMWPGAANFVQDARLCAQLKRSQPKRAVRTPKPSDELVAALTRFQFLAPET